MDKQSKVKIKIINPPICSIAKIPPLGLAYLYTILKNKRYNVEVVDLERLMYYDNSKLYSFFLKLNAALNGGDESIYLHALNVTKKKFAELSKIERVFMAKYLKWVDKYIDKIVVNTNYVLMPMYSRNLLFEVILCRLIKYKNKNIKIIVGGPEVTASKEFIAKLGLVDILVFGEGEETILELMDALINKKPLKDVDGIAYNENKKIKINKARKEIDLNDLPIPDFSAFELDKYPEVLPANSSRGCPFSCVFCWKRLWPTFRTRSVEKVVEELEHQKNRYKNNNFIFCEDMINGSVTHFEDLCREIIKRKLKVKICALAKPKNLPKKLLVLARKAGFYAFFWGIESGSQKVLDDMNKMADVKEMEKVLRDTHSLGMKNLCSFIIAFPTETRKDFLKTIDFIKRNIRLVDYINPSTFSLSKLSDMDVERYGICGDSKNKDLDVYKLNKIKYKIPEKEIKRRVELLKKTTSKLKLDSFTDFATEYLN